MIRRCALIGGTLVHLVAACPEVAVAQEPAPLVVLYAPAQAPPPVSRARTAVGQAARERGTIVVDLSPAVEPPPQAGQRLRRGIEAYHNFEYDVAHEQLQRALTEVEHTGAHGLSPSELTDIYIYRALVSSQRGDSTRAWDDFVRAATIDPTRRLDPVRFPPRVIESYQRALDAVAAARRSAVTVDVAAGCEVRFDARRIGPGDTVRVAQGHHYVRVTCPGHTPYGARLELIEAEVALAPALEAPPPPSPERVVELAGERGARAVIFARVSVSAGAAPTMLLQLLDVASKSEKRRVLASVRDTARSAAEVRGAVQDMIDQVVSPPEPVPLAPAGPAPWYRRPWVWGVAGVAVTAAVLIPFVVQPEPSAGFGVRPGGQFPP